MTDGILGRAIDFTWDGDPILGVRTKTLALNGSAVDVTSDESNGWRKLLDLSGEDTVDITLAGVTKDTVLMDAWFASPDERTKNVSIEYPDGRTITGSFRLVTYTDTGPYKDATTFSATIQSTGPITYTPAG